jgi:hypothetical protein
MLVTLLALAAVQCARLGAAGLFVQLGQNENDRWTSAARAPRVVEVRLAEKYFLDSLDYAPNNPWVYESLAALDLTRMRASRIPRDALAYTRGAHARFRQALLQRPTSPFLWANLALTKLYLDEIDDELLTALRHADELGPYEPTVQQTALFVGLAAWQELSSDRRQALRQSVERGALRNSQKMYEIVKSYGRLDLVCAIKKYETIAGPDCRKAAAAAGFGEGMQQGLRQ